MNKVCNQIYDAVKWNFLITFILSNYDGIVLFSSLEFKTLKLDHSVSVLSFLAALIFNILTITMLALAMHVIYKLRKMYTQSVNSLRQISDTKHQYRAYKIYFELFRESSTSQQAFLVILSCKVYMFYLVISYLFSYPLLQAILIVLLSVSMMIYLIARYPLKQKVKLAQYIVLEAVLLVVNICVLALAAYDHRHMEALHQRKMIGNIVVSCNIVLRVLGPIFIVIQVASIIKEVYEEVKRKRAQRSVIHGQKDEMKVRAELDVAKEGIDKPVVRDSSIDQSLERSNMKFISIKQRSDDISFEQHSTPKEMIQSNKDETSLNGPAHQEELCLGPQDGLKSQDSKSIE